MRNMGMMRVDNRPSPLDFANVVDAAAEFNRSYDGELNLYRNKTCSTYCSKLALHLQA